VGDYTEDIRGATDVELVCSCAKVTKARLLQAVREGAKTLSDIKEMTGACRQGRCKETNPRGR